MSLVWVSPQDICLTCFIDQEKKSLIIFIRDHIAKKKFTLNYIC